MTRTSILMVDGIINLALGVLLMWFPDRLVRLLGVPPAESGFYPNILGGVLFGIGIALLMERRSGPGAGLGVGGAIAINLCGGIVLGAWLVFGGLALPMHGALVLWGLVAMLLGISSLEIAFSLRKPTIGADRSNT